MKEMITYKNATISISKNRYLYYTFVMAFILISFLSYFMFVEDSLNQKSNIQLYSDTLTYENASRTFSFSNIKTFIGIDGNLIGPALLFKLLNNNRYLVLILNYIMFFLAFYIIKIVVRVNDIKLFNDFVYNPLIFFSFFGINKEMISIFVLSLFLYGFFKKKHIFTLAAVLLSILVRWQYSLFFVLIILIESKINPFRKKPVLVILICLFAASVVFSLFAKTIFLHVAMLGQDKYIGGTGLFNFWNRLQNEGLYFLIFIPKAIHLSFGILSRYKYIFDFSGFWNNIVIYLYTFSFLLQFVIFIMKKKYRIWNTKLIYYLIIYLIVFVITPIYSPRYFLPVFVMLCIVNNTDNISLKKLTP